ncbi:ROK family transcriptional regulator [Raineyella sp.]|uniref:ROK family transcriptional regulator n=1 Tax=Raineyella sp. TaxID=1911550 RepID=UPI002B20841B|nr:ROK family protein [Raineyella sp.]MEA5153217.1 ROK family protein [Raineyella sp.]
MAGAPDSTRRRTRQAVYEFVRERGLATKKDIADGLGISLPTVAKYLSYFLEAGLLEEGAKLSSGDHGGRSPIAYTCVADGRFAVGVDVTRDRVRCLVVNLEGRVLGTRRTRRVFERSEDYFAFVGGEVAATIAQTGVDRDLILGVGVAVPGLISGTTGRVTYGRVIDNQGLSAADFAAHIPYETRLVHDSEAAGFAEFWDKTTVDNAFYISLSHSVGGSVLIKNAMYRGDGELAGEIGHMRIHDDGLRCYCGRDGCLDPYCNSTVLSAHTDGSVEDFFAGLAAGDPVLAPVWDRYTTDLAIAVNNIRVMFGCTIVLGGDVGAHSGAQLDDLRRKVEQLDFLDTDSRTFLVPASVREHPIAVGAALYLVDEFRQRLGRPPSRSLGYSQPPRWSVPGRGATGV